MFTLNPGGNGAGKSADSQLSQSLWFFGKLGLYFCVIRGAFLYFAGPEERKALKH